MLNHPTVQEAAGVDRASGQVFTGHISAMSAVFYRRANHDLSAGISKN